MKSKQEKWNSQKAGFSGQKTVQENPREHRGIASRKLVYGKPNANSLYP